MGAKILAACGNDCAACPRYCGEPYGKTEGNLTSAGKLRDGAEAAAPGIG